MSTFSIAPIIKKEPARFELDRSGSGLFWLVITMLNAANLITRVIIGDGGDSFKVVITIMAFVLTFATAFNMFKVVDPTLSVSLNMKDVPKVRAFTIKMVDSEKVRVFTLNHAIRDTE